MESKQVLENHYNRKKIANADYLVQIVRFVHHREIRNKSYTVSHLLSEITERAENF